MTSPKSTQKITDKLKQKNKHLRHKSVKNLPKKWYAKCKVHAFSFEFEKKSDSNPTSVIRKNVSSNGFVSAIIHAYNLHQHLRFSPDDVWLTVAQGVSRHILNSAERFRNLFVNHEGKEDIEVITDDILREDKGKIIGNWPQVIAKLSDVTDERIKKVGLKQLLECDFSTSTNTSITASQIVLLDAMKEYFTYDVMFSCGIPKVTLDGTLEDWLHLQEKVVKIRDLGLKLGFWLDRLEPVIAQFVSTYKGDVDEKFWNMAVFNVPYGCGGFQKEPQWNGWIGALFPYNASGERITENKIVPDEMPSGLVQVPFNLIPRKGALKLSFVAGFFGARQDKVNKEYVVSPVIGWYIADESKSKSSSSENSQFK
ncbi:hypothetical protein Glove_196g33 [Diversispora epigaea]|uniref:DUF4419 domain-containing protein n=1 Tax=Diversispora epigaea TaxID=1348612 RepID=A0A397IUI2_9GLOM|nr:hypothetical protein Glove_196g33 [Diversispora epigaea]